MKEINEEHAIMMELYLTASSLFQSNTAIVYGDSTTSEFVVQKKMANQPIMHIVAAHVSYFGTMWYGSEIM